MPNSPITILLVEDNPADVRLALETIREYKMQNALFVATDGDEALAFLRKDPVFRGGMHANAPTPDLILLDINLPKMDGTEVLAEMKTDPKLASLPVVILTSSKLEQEFLRKNQVNAESYVLKSLTLERYLDAVRCFPHLGVSIVNVASA